MPDISKCENDTCPLRATCYRYVSEPSEFMQAYLDIKPVDGKCDYYWEMRDIEQGFFSW